MAKPETKGKVVSFKAAREAVSGAVMPPQHTEKKAPRISLQSRRLCRGLAES